MSNFDIYSLAYMIIYFFKTTNFFWFLKNLWSIKWQHSWFCNYHWKIYYFKEFLNIGFSVFSSKLIIIVILLYFRNYLSIYKIWNYCHTYIYSSKQTQEEVSYSSPFKVIYSCWYLSFADLYISKHSLLSMYKHVITYLFKSINVLVIT